MSAEQPVNSYFLVKGCCFNCKMIERILDTSLLALFVFGLKSHNLAIRSHSVPGSISSSSATNCFSAFLLEEYKKKQTSKTIRTCTKDRNFLKLQETYQERCVRKKSTKVLLICTQSNVYTKRNLSKFISERHYIPYIDSLYKILTWLTH